MQGSTWFALLGGLLAAGIVALLISATRICYRIEARSGRPLQGRYGLPGYANIVPTAFNVRVARDGETQAMRRRMNLRLLAIPALFGLLYLARTALVAPSP